MSPTQSTDEKIKVAGLRKLQLEIDNLVRINKGWNRVAQFVPLLTIMIAIAAFVFGIIQYRSNQEKEFKKSFLTKQLESYAEITKSAARLAVLDAGDERTREFGHFKELYHGSLRMVADKKVYDETRNFMDYFMDLQSVPTRQREIQEASRRLAVSCRESLQQTWDVPLEELDLPKKP